jgi:hypothetical protein
VSGAGLIGYAIVQRKSDGREVVIKVYSREQWANEDATFLLDLGADVVVRAITREEEDRPA